MQSLSLGDLEQFMIGRLVAALAYALLLTQSTLAQTPVGQMPGGFVGSEAAMFPAHAVRQQQLLDAAFDALAAQRKGVRDFYVLSIGAWSDHVFEHEAKGAADVLSRRFNANGRTLVLTNGAGAGERAYPAASPYHIAAALGRLGQVMDKQEDVLVVYMTSHGNPDGSFSLYDATRFQSVLTPAYLKAALAEVGVVHRIIIISACYSGAFVPALMTDTSILFTAATYNKQSFGCQPERDWTYFGDAFINQTLRSGAPLLEAFDQAKAKIAEWEARDRFDPSWPMSAVGKDTGPILQAMK